MWTLAWLLSNAFAMVYKQLQQQRKQDELHPTSEGHSQQASSTVKAEAASLHSSSVLGKT